MSEQFKVVFAGMAQGRDPQTAATTLAEKLKTSVNKIEQFYKGKPLFAPADKSKALKQVKLLASVGISAKLQAQSASPQSQSAEQERVFEALDYITSSLIRIEERLEDIESRIGYQGHEEVAEESEDEWESKELFDEFDFEPTPPTKSKAWLYYLLAVLVILFIILGVGLFFPEWLGM